MSKFCMALPSSHIQGGCFSTVRQNGGNSKFLVSNAEQPFAKLSYQIFHASAHKLNKNKRFTRVSSVGEAAGVGTVKRGQGRVKRSAPKNFCGSK